MAKKDELYYQCHLTDGSINQTAWIEERAAKVDARVEVVEGDESSFWTVTKVFPFPLKRSILKEKQRMDKNCLPSINVKT